MNVSWKLEFLVMLIEEYESKMARVTEVFAGTDDVNQAASVETSDRIRRKPAVNLEHVFYECFREKSGRAMFSPDTLKTPKLSNLPSQ